MSAHTQALLKLFSLLLVFDELREFPSSGTCFTFKCDNIFVCWFPGCGASRLTLWQMRSSDSNKNSTLVVKVNSGFFSFRICHSVG